MAWRVTEASLQETVWKHLSSDEKDFHYVYCSTQEPALRSLLRPLFMFLVRPPELWYLVLTPRQLLLIRLSTSLEELEATTVDFKSINNVQIEQKGPWHKAISFGTNDGRRYAFEASTKIAGLRRQGEGLDRLCIFLQSLE